MWYYHYDEAAKTLTADAGLVLLLSWRPKGLLKPYLAVFLLSLLC